MKNRGYISALLLSIGGCLSLSAGMSWNTISEAPYLTLSSSTSTQPLNEASESSASTLSSEPSVPARTAEGAPIQVPFAPVDSSGVKYSVKKTVPLTLLDMRARPMDLRNPQNLTSEVEYNEASNCYVIHTRAGSQEVGVPLVLSPEEYAKWSLKRSVSDYYREKNRDLVKRDGDDFDFTNLKFDLGPAEKIFGKGGVQIKTKGSAELSMGLTSTTVDNPSLSERTRSTTAFDFDEKININVNGKVGDKMSMDLNYNTDATFDFDSKKIKLKYEGKEDEIVQLLEAGNVSMPSNNSLITGGSSLFGIRADLQFGKWKFQTVISQQETQTKTVSSKGGVQTTPFEISAADYDENRHFFLADYFRNTFNKNMSQLPNILSGITIKRVELWVTNKKANYDNPRNIVALSELGEPTGNTVPYNRANTLYTDMMSTYAAARSISSVNATLQGNFDNGLDYEKIESARLLSSSEYTLNTALGYVSLKAALQADEVLGVAFEYTYMGQTYQVGELSADITDNTQCLFVKLLKSTVNSPQFPNWNLMMKNVYSLSAYQVQKDNFKLDISYENDATGTALNYISEGNISKQLLLRVMNLDRLDNNNKANPNGVFDFVAGYTVLTDNGRIVFPVTEPFGSWLRTKIGDDAIADKYCFQELYDSTKTYAKQLAERNKFKMTGQYKASSGSEISLGATNVPRGSVVVTAGGVTLVENTDYTVNYTMGVVTIVNQSIIDAGTSVSVSLESNSTYSMQRKTMLGMNATYEASKNLTLGASIMHLSEKPLTTKVSMGDEPINNTIWGLNLAYKKESQWLTNVIDKLPFVNATAPSTLNLTTEFAQLIPGHSSGIQDNASYIDDFEDTELKIDLRTPTSWMLCSTPSRFSEAEKSNDVSYGYNRALMAWYYIDPLFTNKSSSLTPSHIKSDVNQLSNHYVREVYQSEVFPDKETTYTESSTLSVLNLAYYPQERGPYNLDPSLNSDGTLPTPSKRWGGMMRKLDSPDFETANIEYIEFWMLDPFIYNPTSTGGDFYIDLGDVSEDILKDGRKFFENGLPVDGSSTGVDYTVWGKVPTSRSLVYAFDTSSGSRKKQDVGLNGLSSTEEVDYSTYSTYLQSLRNQGVSNMAPFEADPAGDNFHYFRGSDYDEAKMPILGRYKHYNSPEGNSTASQDSPESYEVSAKSVPDVEDINQDFTLNETEKYYEYKLHLKPNMKVGDNYVSSIRTANVKLRNGQTAEDVKWYQFKIPVNQYDSKKGSISDFTSIRFMRMYLTNFTDSVVLRFAAMNLVRADWRGYEKGLKRKDGSTTSLSGNVEISAVNIEENGDKEPVNYVMPPGITRVVDPSQPQLTQENEQALAIKVSNLPTGDAKAVYKTTTLDVRQYSRLQMFVHAEALSDSALNHTTLDNKEVAVFLRLGSDFNNNYYEYEVPLNITPAGSYNGSTLSGCQAVWPENNMIDIDLSVFTDLKRQRNKLKAAYTTPFYRSDANNSNNTVTIVGNPALANIRTMMVGVRNLSSGARSAEVWVNELRLKEFNEEGGWAAKGNLTVQLSDIGTVALTGHMETAGFGGLEQGVSERRTDNYYQYSITTSLEAGRFFPSKLKLQAPLYYSYSKEITSPKYDPTNEDLLLDDVLDTYSTQAEKDSILDIARSIQTYTNFSLSNVKFNIASKRPMPWDPANLNMTYSFSRRHNTGNTTKYENETNWKLGLTYSYSPVYKSISPWKNTKKKDGYMKYFKSFTLNWLPQNIGFNSQITRFYQETQLRDLDNSAGDTQMDVSVSKSYLWNRDFTLRWDLLKNLQMNLTSATQAEIEEPAGVVNKALYPDQYSVWKDSVKSSLLSLGRPLDYKQNFNASYKVPFDLIPVLDWVSSSANYTSSYAWDRGTDLSDGTTLGHTISNQATWTITGKLELEKLYNKVPFLRDTNKKFAASKMAAPKTKAAKTSKDDKGSTDGKDEKNTAKVKKFEKEIQLKRDTVIEVEHKMASRNPRVSAIREDGSRYPIKYKVKDGNKLTILTRDTVKVKLTIQPEKPKGEAPWFKYAQHVSRFAMMVRSVSLTYTNSKAMTLPGFATEIGDFFGQRTVDGLLSPGLDFAFGFADDSYIQKAAKRNWLIQNDSVSSSASTSETENIQLKATLEPFTDFKVDLTASRSKSNSKSIQIMYEGMPTTRTGNFNMTIVTIGTAFESGNSGNGYKSASFDKFLKSLDVIQQRVQAQYANSVYPVGTSNGLAGQPYNAANGEVSKYSADVLIPAFLGAYTGKSGQSVSLGFFPTLTSLMPNWNFTYSGLSRLPFMQRIFKSFDLTHGYKSIYTVGSYNSYSSYLSYMGDLGFVEDVTTGNPTPSSPYDVSTVSINESFSPLIGANMTFLKGFTGKLEYKRTRVLTLSTTALQIVESLSKDIVLGMGYKIVDFSPFQSKMKGRNARKTTTTAANNKTANASKTTNKSATISHDLDLRMDVSFRNQSALNRDIMNATTQATSGNKAVKFSFSADYVLSKQLTLKLYYDYQKNTPLISSSSYPVTNSDFGGTLKFNLTR